MTIVVTLELILKVVALVLLVRFGPLLILLWAWLCASWVERRFIDSLGEGA